MPFREHARCDSSSVVRPHTEAGPQLGGCASALGSDGGIAINTRLSTSTPLSSMLAQIGAAPILPLAWPLPIKAFESFSA